jgi:hypothetical protein
MRKRIATNLHPQIEQIPARKKSELASPSRAAESRIARSTAFSGRVNL